MSNPLPKLPPRAPDSHKGDFGRALLIGGSKGMAGAISLAGMATLRSGAGLVLLAVPEGIQGTVAAFEPSYMTKPLTADSSGRLRIDAQAELEKLVADATCIAIGPGLGQSPGLRILVEWLYTTCPKPLVIDADALNLLSQLPAWPTAAGPRILTPHPGEFRRLIHDTSASADELPARAERFAAEHGVVLILKGHQSLITDGHASYRNTTGNPGMATGGSGDVLTGILTALVCQKLTPIDAARLGAHLHGLAGDLAAAELGQVSLIASDLIRFLPKAFQAI